MPPLRGGRTLDTPRTQAAPASPQLASAGCRVFARPGRWPGRHRPLPVARQRNHLRVSASL